jgi:hypothetical protein
VRLSPLGTSATNCPLVPSSDDTRVRSSWWNEKITRRKPAPTPLHPPLVTHVLTWNRTSVAAVRSRRPTAWAMARISRIKRSREISKSNVKLPVQKSGHPISGKALRTYQNRFLNLLDGFCASATSANGLARKWARADAARRQYISAYCEQTHTQWWARIAVTMSLRFSAEECVGVSRDSDGRETGVQFPAGERLSLLHNVQTGSGAHPAS